MDSNFFLKTFEFLTIILSVSSVILGVRELYSRIEKKASRIKKLLLIVAALTAISATGTWHFGNTVTKEKEDSYNNKLLEAEERIAKNEAFTAGANLKSDSLENELHKTMLDLETLRASVRDRVIPSSKIPLIEDLIAKHKAEGSTTILVGNF